MIASEPTATHTTSNWASAREGGTGPQNRFSNFIIGKTSPKALLTPPPIHTYNIRISTEIKHLHPPKIPEIPLHAVLSTSSH